MKMNVHVNARCVLKSGSDEFSSLLSDVNFRARHRSYSQRSRRREIYQAPVHNESSNINRRNFPTSCRKSLALIWPTRLRCKFPRLFRLQQKKPWIGIIESSEGTVFCFVNHTHRDNNATCQHGLQANHNNHALVL
jgi:hypothetical protein